MLQVVSYQNVPFNVKVLKKGDTYGLNKCLTHEDERPVVEFYDARHDFDPEGQFVSRYYVETLLEDEEGGLDLMGYEPSWKLDHFDMKKVRSYLLDVVA